MSILSNMLNKNSTQSEEFSDQSDFMNLSKTNYTNASKIEEDFGITIGYFIGDFLTHYYTPALVLIGSAGNILSVIVFFKTKLRKLSSSYYLAALGISDTCFLLGTFVSWLSYYNINVYNREYYCQIFTYFSGLCSFLSVWFVVAFTIERFIAVLYPLKRQTICTVKRACTILALLIFLGCFINIPYFIYAAPQFSAFLDDYVCDVREEYKVILLKSEFCSLTPFLSGILDLKNFGRISLNQMVKSFFSYSVIILATNANF
jgi:7 transmembrane receptor (rhodopsin family)